MKKINMSKRGYSIFYLDKCKIYTRNGTLAYSIAEIGREDIFNIPYLNTSILMIGPSSTITNEAVRLFSQNSGIIMFVGAQCTPLYAESSQAFTILSPASEYGPTAYAQSWFKIFMDDSLRLTAGKILFQNRIRTTNIIWKKLLSKYNFNIPTNNIDHLFESYSKQIEACIDTNAILLIEAKFTKKIFQIFAQHYNIDFKRVNKDGEDKQNQLLTHGNYLCYGLGAATLSSLGIPFSLPILHGKTRRGALVFDIADLIKDAISIPCAFHFSSTSPDISSAEYRRNFMEMIEKEKIFDLLFDQIIETIIEVEKHA